MRHKSAIEPELHWTDHFIKHGFAVLKNLVDPDFIAEARREIGRLLGTSLPMSEWTAEGLSFKGISVPGSQTNPLLARVYDQPRLRAAIDEMFGAGRFSAGERCFQAFVTPIDRNAPRALSNGGHIDYVNIPIPVFGRGFAFQVSLVDKEPFGGNIQVWPGSHKRVQRAVMSEYSWRYPTDWKDITVGEPFEFVPEAGDVFFFHHLIAHSGNSNSTSMPRVSLHCQAWQKEWPVEIDPGARGLSPWERSLVLDERYHITPEERTLRERDLSRIAAA